MADTTAPLKPKWQLLLELLRLPLVDKVVMAGLGFLIGIATPWAMNRIVIPAADPPSAAREKHINEVANRVAGQLGDILYRLGDINDRVIRIEGKRDYALDQIEVLRKDPRLTPARSASPAKAATIK